jgi:hypothetical protein
MMVNSLFYLGLVFAILRHKRGAEVLPAFLFIAHLLTLAQFEPDLGSFLRHYSSVLVLLAPGIEFIFAPKTQAQEAQPQIAKT